MNTIVTSPAEVSTPAAANNQPVTPVVSAKSHRAHSEQNQRIANAVAVAARLIDAARSSTDVSAALQQIGYTAAEMTAGRVLADVAQAKFAARQVAKANQMQFRVDRDQNYERALDDFRAYRIVVRAAYPAEGRASLGVSDAVAVDKEKFASNVRSAYAAAQSEPHLSTLSRYGFTAVRFQAMDATLTQFIAADAAFKQADRLTARATVERDEAAVALTKWMSTFRKLAQIAFKRQPSLRAELGLS